MAAIRIAKLGDIAAIIDYGHTASATFEPIGPKFLRITDIQNDRVEWNLVPFCRYAAENGRSAKLEVGDIVFARTGATTGKSFLIRECPDNSVFASYLIRVRFAADVCSSYIAHFFKTPEYWRQVHRSSTGTAQAGVNASSLKLLELPLPPLPKQRRIAAILDQASSLLARRRAAMAKLNTLAQSIFVDVFGDPVRNPKGWSEALLGDLAEIVSGITKGRKLVGKQTRDVPYLAVINVQDRSLNMGFVKRIAASEDEIARYRLLRNDLLLTEGGDPDKLGRGTLWNDEVPECIHQNHVFRVRVTSPCIDPVFLNWLVGSQRGKKYFLRSAKQTTGIASINKTQLQQFPVLIPTLVTQKDFASRVTAIEKVKAQQRSSLELLDALFASLQHRAFRGEL